MAFVVSVDTCLAPDRGNNISWNNIRFLMFWLGKFVDMLMEKGWRNFPLWQNPER